MSSQPSDSLLSRIAVFDAPLLTIFIDGSPVQVRTGESVLAAVLCHRPFLRRHETSAEPRAGFCLMGACQDCWVWFGPDRRGRACTTPVAEGMRIVTDARQEGSALG